MIIIKNTKNVKMSLQFYKVGGCIRDKLLNLKFHDIDYCIEVLSYDDMLRELNTRGVDIIYEKRECFLVRGRYLGSVCDFTCCRQRDTAQGFKIGTLVQDLERRDFTINAIAEDELGHLIDPFGGQSDCTQKIIRLVSGEDCLIEDPIRILRALRFRVVLSHFKFDFILEQALHKPHIIQTLTQVPSERMRQELTKCFEHNTFLTLKILTSYPVVTDIIFNHNIIWLKPTLNLKVNNKLNSNQIEF